MYIEITAQHEPEEIDSFYNPWAKEGFFVATVGETATGYLYDRTFRLHELAYCAKVTFVNVAYYSYYKSRMGDNERAKSQWEADTKTIAEKCAKKHLYVLSELDDAYAADQCVELANSNGDEGFSVLITHEKSKQLKYFEKVKDAFNIVIYLPNDAEYTTEILRWLICDFSEPGWIGVDYNNACSILKQSKEAICRKKTYANVDDMKNNFHNDFIDQNHTSYNREKEQINRLLGLWVPRNYQVEEAVFIYDEATSGTQGEIVVSGLHNEQESDESWTIALLSGVARHGNTAQIKNN